MTEKPLVVWFIFGPEQREDDPDPQVFPSTCGHRVCEATGARPLTIARSKSVGKTWGPVEFGVATLGSKYHWDWAQNLTRMLFRD